MRSLLRHLLCAPLLAQLFDKKDGLPCAGCGSGLLVTTQRMTGAVFRAKSTPWLLLCRAMWPSFTFSSSPRGARLVCIVYAAHHRVSSGVRAVASARMPATAGYALKADRPGASLWRWWPALLLAISRQSRPQCAPASRSSPSTWLHVGRGVSNAGRARGTCQVEASLDLAPSIIDGIRRQTLIAERRSTVASAASTCSNSFMGLTAPSWA